MLSPDFQCFDYDWCLIPPPVQICKDQTEVEVWFAGLNALIPSGPRRRSRVEGHSDRISYSDVCF